MSDKRQKNQLQMALAFTGEGRCEAPRARREGTESLTAKRMCESPAIPEQVMEEVCGGENCLRALRRVKANQGSPGIDGMKVSELPGYLKQHWPAIREQLQNGTYKPTGATSRDRQAGRRSAPVGHSDGAGSVHPGGGDAGSARQVGPDVLRTQSRISSAAFGASGGSQGAAVYRRRTKIAIRDLEAEETTQLWHLANSPALSIKFSNAYFASLGLPRLFCRVTLTPPNRRMRTRMYGGVAGEERRLSPLCRFAGKC